MALVAYDNTREQAAEIPGEEIAAFLREKQQTYNADGVRQRISALTDSARARGLLSDDLYEALVRRDPM